MVNKKHIITLSGRPGSGKSSTADKVAELLGYTRFSSGNMVREVCQLNKPGQILLKKAMERLQLSARAYDRILKVARTAADLSQSKDIKIEHLAEAIQYRSLDREGWAG